MRVRVYVRMFYPSQISSVFVMRQDGWSDSHSEIYPLLLMFLTIPLLIDFSNESLLLLFKPFKSNMTSCNNNTTLYAIVEASKGLLRDINDNFT